MDYALGEEIWSQTEGAVDAFVHSVGTGASSRGVATVLKRYKPSVHIAVVEPGESVVLWRTAIQIAQRLGPGRTVVTLMADSGLKYLNTDMYRSE